MEAKAVNYRRMGVNRLTLRLDECEVCERDLSGDEFAGTSWCGVDACRECIECHAEDNCEICESEHAEWLAWAKHVMSRDGWPR